MSGWTPQQNVDFLLTIIGEHPPVKGDWITISAKFGQDKSADACRQHYAKLLKTKTVPGENTDSGTTDTAKTTRGVAKKVPNAKKRKAATPLTEEGPGDSADEEGFEGFENFADVKNTLEAVQAAGKRRATAAAKGAAAGKAKAEVKPKATRANTKKVKGEAGKDYKTVKYSPDEGLAGAAGEEDQSE